MVSEAPALVRPLRRDEYDQLIALGRFVDERIELLDGALVPMSPIGPPHSSTVQRLNELLVLRLAGRASIRIQSPFAAGVLSEPEPDLAVVPLGSYDQEHPDQAYLIIEVAESSLSVDRGRKARIYAASGVPEYWIVDLAGRRLEMHLEPEDGRYQRIITLRDLEAVVTIGQFPDVSLRLGDIVR